MGIIKVFEITGDIDPAYSSIICRDLDTLTQWFQDYFETGYTNDDGTPHKYASHGEEWAFKFRVIEMDEEEVRAIEKEAEGDY